MPKKTSKILKNLCRTAFDKAGAVLILGIMGPFALASAPLLAIETNASPIFVQKRIGKDGKEFNIYKLRTYDKKGQINGVSRWVRRTKLDEVPQVLFNILCGNDMSLVGPRPHIKEDAIAHELKRQSVKPGLTGFGKIIGGNNCSHEEELAADLLYIEACEEATLSQFIRLNAILLIDTPKAIFTQWRAPLSYADSRHSLSI